MNQDLFIVFLLPMTSAKWLSLPDNKKINTNYSTTSDTTLTLQVHATFSSLYLVRLWYLFNESGAYMLQSFGCCQHLFKSQIPL